jgi:hypothetical protein
VTLRGKENQYSFASSQTVMQHNLRNCNYTNIVARLKCPHANESSFDRIIFESVVLGGFAVRR